METPSAVTDLADRLRCLGWVTDLFVGGSVATGDYRPGVSDIDLVALTERRIDTQCRSSIIAIHRSLEATTAAGVNLGRVARQQDTAVLIDDGPAQQRAQERCQARRFPGVEHDGHESQRHQRST